jgi:hypothetical protein
MRVLVWLPRMFAGVGVVMMGASLWLYRGEQGFVRRATRTEGVVTALNYRTDSDGGGAYYPVFRFTDDAGSTHEVQARAGSKPASREVGEQVPVLYDPADPDGARIDSYFNLHVGSFVTTILALVFGGVGIIWLWLARRAAALEEELRRSGVRIEARVVEVEERRNITVNRKHPWRIIAESDEPARAGQRFRSANIWDDPRPHMKETVTVFVDRNDPRRHHVDIGFLPPR